MKKAFLILIIITLLMLLTQLTLFARHRHSSRPSSFINLYNIEDHVAAGLKQRVIDNIYGTANIQYRDSESELEFQLGGMYLLPYKVLFFRFYGGSGLQVARNTGFQYPYLVLGTDFFIFFSETIYPLKEKAEPKLRGGFSFRF
jgi:hypothetical protein